MEFLKDLRSDRDIGASWALCGGTLIKGDSSRSKISRTISDYTVGAYTTVMGSWNIKVGVIYKFSG